MGTSFEVQTPLDELDLNIIRILMKNGRETSVAIAQQLGITDKTVNKRLAKLLKDKVIRIRAAPDPRKIGFSILAVIGIQTDVRNLSKTTEEIAAMSRTNFVGLSTGAHDIIILAVFRSQDELSDFLIEKLAAISHIRRIETYTILRVFKRTADWELPEDLLQTCHKSHTRTKERTPSRRRA